MSIPLCDIGPSVANGMGMSGGSILGEPYSGGKTLADPARPPLIVALHLSRAPLFPVV
jgi:hypothetical protein